MRFIHSYFSWIAIAAIFLALWSPIIQVVAEIVHWFQHGTFAKYDLYTLFPDETAAWIERIGVGTPRIAFDLLFDIWAWIPAIVVLALVGITHSIFAGFTRR